MLEPLLSDLKRFEEDGIFVPCLGKIIKGTVFSVIDKLINLELTQLVGLLKAVVVLILAVFLLESGPNFRNLK